MIIQMPPGMMTGKQPVSGTNCCRKGNVSVWVDLGPGKVGWFYFDWVFQGFVSRYPNTCLIQQLQNHTEIMILTDYVLCTY